MRKYSRKNGWMWLSSYAPGDGSIDFTWAKDNDRNGECLSEFVSESDISEWLEQPEQKGKWRDWDIISIGKSSERHIPAMNRLVKIVSRPFHTSKTLQAGESRYEYVYHGPQQDKHGSKHYTAGNTTFYEVEGEDKVTVRNAGIQLGLCFFLNNEEEFERSGFRVRQTARETAQSVPA